MPRLRACKECSRHVWIHESICPFCGCTLSSIADSALPLPRAGLSRSQRLMLAAAIAGQALGACAEATTGAEALADGGPMAGSTATAGSAGGAGSLGTAGAAGSATAGRGGAMDGGVAGRGYIAPPYGAIPPPPTDAGKPVQPADDDAGDQDAGTE